MQCCSQSGSDTSCFTYNFFCIDFPIGCKNFTGPHSITCYISLWKNAGCTEEGREYPQLLEVVKDYEYYYFNLKYAILV